MKDIKCPVDQGKYIPKEEIYKLEQEYIKFVNKLLASKKNTGKQQGKENKIENGSSQKQAETVNAPTKTQNETQIPEGRFSGKQQPKNKVYFVSDIKFSKEKDFTLVMLETPFGEKVKAFIKGQTNLKNGDSLTNPVIEVKKSAKSDSYNLITGYENAA